MKSSSPIVNVIKIMLVTGITIIVLILMATYASVLGTKATTSTDTETMMPEVVSGISPGFSGMGMVGEITRDFFSSADQSIQLTTNTIDQKVIKTASLDIETKSAADAVSAISSIATNHQGFVQNSSVNEATDGRKYANITIRVPSSEFGTAMTEIKGLATRINVESVSGQDVTEQYVDVAARLTAAKAQETQYLLILAQAKTVTDILAVQEQLSIVRSDIESLQGQINFLENQTSLATISVSITEEPSTAIPSNAKFDLVRDAKAAIAFIISLGQQVLSVLVWVVIIGIGVGIPAGIIYFIVRAIKNRINEPKRRR